MAVVGYARISTEKQENENQKYEIEKWAGFHDLTLDRYIAEEISTKKEDREIFKILDQLGENDVLISTELSRIGRTFKEVLNMIDIILSKNIRLICTKQKIDLNKDDPMSMFQIHILMAFNQLERSLNNQRTKGAIEARKNRRDKEIKEIGVSSITIGRVKGSKNKEHKLLGKEKEIQKYIDMGIGKSNIAKMMEVSRPTLYAFLEEMGVKSDE